MENKNAMRCTTFQLLDRYTFNLLLKPFSLHTESFQLELQTCKAYALSIYDQVHKISFTQIPTSLINNG